MPTVLIVGESPGGISDAHTFTCETCMVQPSLLWVTSPALQYVADPYIILLVE